MSFGQELPPSGLYTRILRKVEFPLITAALAATRGNQIRAADLLGLNRNTLRKKIRDLGIKVIRTPEHLMAARVQRWPTQNLPYELDDAPHQ